MHVRLSMSLDSKLPDDIIYEIYRVSFKIDPPRAAQSNYYYHSQPATLGWINLTHVCRRWRMIGLEVSSLWAGVLCVFSPDVKAILKRAKNAKLTIVEVAYVHNILAAPTNPYLGRKHRPRRRHFPQRHPPPRHLRRPHRPCHRAQRD